MGLNPPNSLQDSYDFWEAKNHPGAVRVQEASVKLNPGADVTDSIRLERFKIDYRHLSTNHII